MNRRNSKLALGTSGTSRITILGNGNVGIGTSIPVAKLEVSGDTKISGNASTTGSLNIGTANPLETLGALFGAGDLYVGDGATVTQSLYVGGNSEFVGTLKVTGQITGDVTGDLTGNAATATASADNPDNCAAGSYPLGVDANWDVESCTDATTEINSVVNGLGGTNLTCAAQSCDVDDAFLVNNANDSTSGDLTIGGDLIVDGEEIGLTSDINLLHLAANYFQINGNASTTGDFQLTGTLTVETGQANERVTIGNTAADFAGITITDSSGNNDRVIIRDSSDHVYIGDLDDNNGSLFLRAGGATELTILDGGAATFADNLTVQGDTQLGNSASADSIGINVAASAAALISGQFSNSTDGVTANLGINLDLDQTGGTDGGTNAQTGMFLDMDYSGNIDAAPPTAGAGIQVGFNLDLDSSAVVSGADLNSFTQIGNQSDVNFTGTIGGQPGQTLLQVGFFTDVTFAGISGETEILYGVFANVNGDLNVGPAVHQHYGGYFEVDGTANQNYGLFVNMVDAGASASYGLFIDQNENDTGDYGIWIDSESTATLGGGIHVADGDVYVADLLKVDGDLGTSSCAFAKEHPLWAEEGAALSTGVALGLQWSFGNGRNLQGVPMVCAGKVKSLALTCAVGSGVATGVVRIAINGVSAGATCSVNAPNAANGVSSDTSCDISFAVGDRVGFITTTSDAGDSDCIVFSNLQYD